MPNVILSAARTPIGKLSGALATVSATDLAAIAIAAALDRADLRPEQLDRVVFGQVLQAGQGGNAARQAAAAAGVPLDVPAITLNKMCLSGLAAVHLADLLISVGEADIVVAGGMESMTGAPHLLRGARAGYRLGGGELVDVIMQDGLLCAFEHISMGAATERQMGSTITRGDQDRIAARSHEHAAAAATKSGRLASEIVAVPIPQRRGDPLLVTEDEGVRPGTTAETLAGLAPAFSEGGSITPGNASQISDGAAALIVTSAETARRLGVEPLAVILGYGEVAGPDTSLLHQPSGAIRRALESCSLGVGDVDVFEINEAFAAVSLASMRDLGIDEEVVNVNGGAIALGHPIGMSGARLCLTLAFGLAQRGGGIGAAGLCGGGGQGDAIVLRAPA